MPTLVVRSRTGTLQTVPLSERPVKVGRAETCDIILRNDAEVSREHAEIWVDRQGRVQVVDRNSKNGTRVDEGEPFRGTTRTAYSVVRIGEHEIEIRDAAPRSAADEAVRFVDVDSPTTMASTRYFPSSKQLDLSNHRLQLLIGLTERIGGAYDRKQLLEQALDAVCEALRFERGLIALKTERGDTEHPVTRNIQRDDSGAYKVSRTLINRALVHGERAIVNNPATDLVDNLSESLVRYPICSALCVPIMHRDEILGVVYGDRITRADTYTPGDVDFFAAIAQQLGVGLVNLRAFQQHMRLQELQAELDKARGIQRNLLPSGPFDFGRVTVAGYNEPSAHVSGDYYDYFEVGDGRIGFIIADVTGHGLSAALIMANLQAAMRVALTANTPLPDLAARINLLVCNNTRSNVFITGILGIIDALTGAIDYVSAGHPGPLLIGKGGVTERSNDNSLPLGIEPAETFDVRRIEPSDDLDVVLYYTDGLIEAIGEDGRLMTLEPVSEALGSLHERSGDAVLRTTLSTVRRHLSGAKNQDDLTLLAIQFDRD